MVLCNILGCTILFLSWICQNCFSINHVLGDYLFGVLYLMACLCFRHLSPCTVACVYRSSGETHCWLCPVSTPFAKHAGNNIALYWSKMAWEWVSGESKLASYRVLSFWVFSVSLLRYLKGKWTHISFWPKQQTPQNITAFNFHISQLCYFSDEIHSNVKLLT